MYDEQPAFDKFMNKYTGDYLSNKLNASMYESAVMHYSNYLGNAGNYDMSDIYASEGIKVEIECERMHPLSTLLYCIAWNNERRGKVSPYHPFTLQYPLLKYLQHYCIILVSHLSDYPFEFHR